MRSWLASGAGILLTLTPLCISLSFGAAAEGPAPVVSNPLSFRMTSQLADSLEDNNTAQKYRQEKFYPAFAPRMGAALKECFKAFPQHSNASFSFIVSLEASGEIHRIDLDKATDISHCMTVKLATTSLPAPPFVPFAEKIDIALGSHGK